jgi:hypothetical protein
MILKYKNYLYYLLFAFIGYVIYKFQIEKSFNLLSIYVLSVIFSFFCFISRIEPRKSLPVLFVVSLFVMYGVSVEDEFYQVKLNSFFFLISIILLLLVVLLVNYNRLIKKIITIAIALVLAGVYIIQWEALSDYKYIPFVIGSLFMFRSISFLHEIKFMKREIPLLDKVNYFLLPPNLSMPLFPIVDYKSFISSYEGINTNTLRRSSLLICRGLVQMIIYRFIYHKIIIPFDEIHTALQVFTFLIANFLIVLRVIAAFHIAIGLVILTGYNIPDIFNNIFFSTGFSNLWRRTNMYWRNFMIKIFYYPIYFKIKKIGIYPALFISTFICFIITWILHTYQWFWLKGTFPLELKDAIFWGSFGILVSVNTLLQQRDLDRSVTKKENVLTIIKQAFSGLIVLLVMSILWSIWTCNSLSNWWTIIKACVNIDYYQVKHIVLFSVIYIAIASVYHFSEREKNNRPIAFKKFITRFSYIGFVLFCLFLIAASQPENNYVGKLLNRASVAPLLREHLNRADLISIDNGYYTNLISTNNYCSQIWANDYDISGNWSKNITKMTTRSSNDLMLTENIPFASVKYNGIVYTLNKDGLRDKEYSKVKPDSCYRIIILGGSFECGNGMNDGEDFISLVESELNNKYRAAINNKPVHIELINFSSNGYRLFQRLYQFKDKAQYWNPDAVFVFIHTNYHHRIASYVNRLVYQGYSINDPYLKNVIEMRNITKDDNGDAVSQKLGEYADSINYYALRNISEIAHRNGTMPVVVYLPAIKDKNLKSDSLFVEDICNKYDMKKISLAGVFDGYEKKDLVLSNLDFHPNKKANGLIANKLLKGIINHQDYFNIQFTAK